MDYTNWYFKVVLLNTLKGILVAACSDLKMAGSAGAVEATVAGANTGTGFAR